MRKYLIILCLILFQTPADAQYLYRLPSPKPVLSTTDTTRIFIIGDVMMHKAQLSHDCEFFLKYIEPHMQKADFCIANMEFPLGGEPYSGYPAFSAPDWYAEYIARCGADVFLTANNHILDKGTKGLRRTMGIYDRMADSLGINYTGIGKEPLILKRRGMRIALVNFTYGTNSFPSELKPDVLRMRESDVSEVIESARSAGADFIVALPHWGTEYRLQHDESQVRWARWLVGQGCCAVVGTHPHVVQDTTHIKGVPIIYSLGNAVSNMSLENTRLELAVTLSFVHDFRSGEMFMLEPQLNFMWCTLPGRLTESYATIMVKEWASRRDDWLTPSDFDNMMATLQRVKAATGIKAD